MEKGFQLCALCSGRGGDSERCVPLVSIAVKDSGSRAGLTANDVSATVGADVEMSSAAESAKFRHMDPIDKSEIRSVDLDDLCRKLTE